MDHAAFILGSWIGTAVAVIAYATWVLRRGRVLSKHASTEEKPWT
ncbi:MAG: hypothetical protein NWP73_00890 [Ilumatobacteraceae bacterium]|jgi:hypothetical protein|nr:hypothetical protein [Ilumatobacteraceae bacterium]